MVPADGGTLGFGHFGGVEKGGQQSEEKEEALRSELKAVELQLSKLLDQLEERDGQLSFLKGEKDRLEGTIRETQGRISAAEAGRGEALERLKQTESGALESVKLERARREELEARSERLERELAEMRSAAEKEGGMHERNEALSKEIVRLEEKVRLLGVQKSAINAVPDSWTLEDRVSGSETGGIGLFFRYALCLLLGSGLGVGLCVTVARISPVFWEVTGMGVKGGGVVPVRSPAVSSVREGALKIDGLWAGVSPVTPTSKRLENAPKLPTSFMGVPFGAPTASLQKNGDKSGWKESGGNMHRVVELSGRKDVHAVVVPDKEGRLVMGAYLKVASRQSPELKEFLEWAVSVNDDLMTRFGRPSGLHQISGVNDAEEVVEKISEGGDYYEATWEREGQDTRLSLSIRPLNEHNVIFRLDYVSQSLSRPFSEGDMGSNSAQGK